MLHHCLTCIQPIITQLPPVIIPENAVAAAGQVDCTVDDDADIGCTTSYSESVQANNKYTHHSAASQQQHL